MRLRTPTVSTGRPSTIRGLYLNFATALSAALLEYAARLRLQDHGIADGACFRHHEPEQDVSLDPLLDGAVGINRRHLHDRREWLRIDVLGHWLLLGLPHNGVLAVRDLEDDAVANAGDFNHLAFDHLGHVSETQHGSDRRAIEDTGRLGFENDGITH